MFLKGLFTLFASSVLSVGASLIINLFPQGHTTRWWISLLCFNIIFIGLNLLYNIKTNQRSYSEMLLSTIAGKTFLLLIIIFLYSIADKNGLFSFSMHFITHYILFTLFEMRYLLYIIKIREVKKI